MKLIPYLADTSAGVGTLVIVTRLPGFTGPNPSTSLDKVIQLLAAIVGRWGGGCQGSSGEMRCTISRMITQIPFGLSPEHFRVSTVCSHQFRMAARLDDLAIVENDYPINQRTDPQSVADDQRGLAGGHL